MLNYNLGKHSTKDDATTVIENRKKGNVLENRHFVVGFLLINGDLHYILNIIVPSFT